MNKKVVVIGSGILAVIVSGVLYLSMDKKTSQPLVNKEAGQSSSDSQTPTNGKYVDYNADIFAKTPGTKLLFFYAPWCPQCRDLEKDIKQRGVPANVTIIKVDYDSNQDLRKKYGVTLQTTFVKVDDSGQLIDKFTAYYDPTLKAVIDNLL